MRYLSGLLAGMLGLAANAGQDCVSEEVAAPTQAAAAEHAMTVAAALDGAAAPVALIARVGTDLSAHGLHYSHVAIAFREDGVWRVMHLLNTCGTDDSALFVDGLFDYFLDARVSLDTGIVWLSPELAARVDALIANQAAARLHDSDYNVIAHPRSQKSQNSTAFVLEVLAVAMQAHAMTDRVSAQRYAAASGFQPHHLHIPYSQRIVGGLFSANAHFTDHPLAARLAGDYAVVTVASIFDWLQRNDAISGRRDIRHIRP